MGLPRGKAPVPPGEEMPPPPPQFVPLPPGLPMPPPPNFVPGAPYYPPPPGAPPVPYPPQMMMPPPPIPPPEQMAYYGAAPVPMTAPLEGQPTAPEDKDGKPEGNERFKGPLSAKRSCTDVLCIGLFLAVVIGFIAVTLAGFFIGNPFILFMGHNSNNQMCGIGMNSKKTLLFTFDSISCFASSDHTKYMADGCSTSITKSVCVEKCPQLKNASDPWNWPAFADQKVKDVFKDELSGLCLANAEVEETVEANVKAGKCPPYVFQSKDFYFRCEPSFLTESTNGSLVYELAKTFKDSLGNDLGQRIDLAIKNINTAHKSLPFLADIIDDLSKTWPHILVFVGFTMVASFIWILLMRFIGPCVIWFATIVLVVGSICATIFLWIVYDALNRGDEYALGVVPTKDLGVMPKDLWLVIAFIVSLITLIILVIFCALYNRIRLAAAVVTESSHAIGGSMAALLWPIFPFILQLIVHALFVCGLIFFLTATSTESDKALDFNALWNNLTNMWVALVCLLFAWFWISNFVLALNYVTLAGSFSSWYWNSGTPDAERLQLFAAFWRAIRYHIGSMAFGALIIAIVQTIRTILLFFQRQFAKMKNPIGTLLLKCLTCCVWCVEKFLKFLTKNAYIMVAIEGKHFCASARKAFKLILENAARILVLDTLSTALIAISVFIIVGGMGTFALFIFYPSLIGWTTLPEHCIPDVKYFYIPLIVEVIASLLAALCFFSVYKMAIDTIFLNLMYDLKFNDGTPEKPYRAKKSLLNVVGRKNKKEKKEAQD